MELYKLDIVVEQRKLEIVMEQCKLEIELKSVGNRDGAG